MKDWFMAGSHPKDYEHGIDNNTTYESKNAAYLKSIVADIEGFGTLMQMFQADDFRNKRMRFSSMVKSEEVDGWAGLWMRVDGPEQGKHLEFDNMQDRSITGTTDWQRYEVVLDVPQESTNVAFGILLHGTGRVWLSDVDFGEVGIDVPVTSVRNRKYPKRPGNLDFSE